MKSFGYDTQWSLKYAHNWKTSVFLFFEMKWLDSLKHIFLILWNEN